MENGLLIQIRNLMVIKPKKHHRRSIRLHGYDYASGGAYFVTICTHSHKCVFGEIINGQMALNNAGQIAEHCWTKIPFHFPHIGLDVFVVMPNHVHGILFIDDYSVGAKNFSPLQSGQRPRGTSKTIGSVIRGFKIGVTKWMRRHTYIHNVWQRNYFEHIIRNEIEWDHLREYIINNPMKWECDRNHPSFWEHTG
jgi:REP element-mobilizing transposase RayT